jgi:hypothetical protein
MASDHYVWLAWSIVFLVLWGIIFASFPDERRKNGCWGAMEHHYSKIVTDNALPGLLDSG